MSAHLQRFALPIQMIGGALAGLILAVPVAILTAALTGASAEGLQDIGFALIGTAFAYPLGVALGVWGIGKGLGQRGTFWYAVVGSYIGVIVVAMLASAGLMAIIVVLQIVFIVLPPIFATLAYHRFARRSDALNPYDDGDVDLLAYHDEGWED